jgi:hypothetical protein
MTGFERTGDKEGIINYLVGLSKITTQGLYCLACAIAF